MKNYLFRLVFPFYGNTFQRKAELAVSGKTVQCWEVTQVMHKSFSGKKSLVTYVLKIRNLNINLT